MLGLKSGNRKTPFAPKIIVAPSYGNTFYSQRKIIT